MQADPILDEWHPQGYDNWQEMMNMIVSLRKQLHACPEVSGQEQRTKAVLMDFLKTHTTLEIHPCGNGFYAAHRENHPQKPAVALRAD